MTPTAPTPPTPTPPPKRVDRADNPLRSLLVLIFRLLLLGVGGTIAGLLGILAAQIYPAPRTQDPPLLEKLLQRADDLQSTLNPVPAAKLSSPSLESETAASAPASPSPSPSLRALAPADRQRLQSEVATLQTELTNLGNRTTSIETQVGITRISAPLEARLQTLSAQLRSPTASTPAVSPDAPPAVSPPIATPDPNRLGVTLPIDALFTGESLRPESQILLNTVVGELQRYPNSAILVGAHADAGTAAQTRSRSFAQAQAIVRSLEGTLGDSYHWVAVGYGQTAPIAPNDSPANRQRNRRIEIGIFPRE